MQRRIDGILGRILHLPKHGLSLELVIQFLGLQEFPILLLEGVGKLIVLLTQVVMVQFHTCGVNKRIDLVRKEGQKGSLTGELVLHIRYFRVGLVDDLVELDTQARVLLGQGLGHVLLVYTAEYLACQSCNMTHTHR